MGPLATADPDGPYRFPIRHVLRMHMILRRPSTGFPGHLFSHHIPPDSADQIWHLRSAHKSQLSQIGPNCSCSLARSLKNLEMNGTSTVTPNFLDMSLPVFESLAGIDSSNLELLASCCLKVHTDLSRRYELNTTTTPTPTPLVHCT